MTVIREITLSHAEVVAEIRKAGYRERERTRSLSDCHDVRKDNAPF